MAWARLDDSYPDHPKVIGLSDAAFRLHVRAICYSSRLLTDGVLPAIWLNGHAEQVKELVGAGLMDETPDGFRLHDYHDFQPTRREILNRREAKMRAGRAGANARWHTHSRKDSTRYATAIAPAIESVMPPSPPLPSHVGEEKTPPKPPRKRGETSDALFEEFWKAYPKKVAKGKAFEVWKKLSDSSKASAVSAVIRFAEAWADATDAAREFLVGPAPWLHQKRWEDDPREWKRQASRDRAQIPEARTHPATLTHAPGWDRRSDEALAREGVDLKALQKAREIEK